MRPRSELALAMATDSLIPISSAQAMIDALSIALQRSVLLDDATLVPIAYSRQWDVDDVRSTSIMGRGPKAEVREALLAVGIADAHDIVRIPADPALAMNGRVCMPVRGGHEVVGYIWLLDPDQDLGNADLQRVRRVAGELGSLLSISTQRHVTDEAELLEQLRSSAITERERGVERSRARHLLPDGPLVLCLAASTESGVDAGEAVRQAARRLSVGQALAAAVAEGAALIASLGDPVLRSLPPTEIANWLLTASGSGLVVGQSAPATLGTLDTASRQSELALRIARVRGWKAAAWATLGADRLIVQLPAAAHRDIPEPLAHLIREEPVLTETLGAFLDAGGDVKKTAAALCLHRSGLYYRLRRIQEISGLDLNHGDDRLLAHLAIRSARMS